MAVRADKDPLAHLKKDGPRPIYAIDGEERILINEALDAIKSRALASGLPEFNLDTFNAKQTPMARVVDAAQTLPAFAPTRMVIVKDAEKIAAAEADILLRYLSDPSPTTVLVFVAEKFDARTKLYKAFKKAGAALRFARPREREMHSIVARRAKPLRLSLEPGAARALIESVGTDIGGAVAALEKLALYLGPDQEHRVRASDVEEVVSHAKEESIFQLADAVGTGDTPLALETLEGMLLGTRGHPLGLLAMIARHWRRLTLARSMMDAGAARVELQSAFDLHPFALEKLLNQARNQNSPALVAGLEAISEADQALKGGKLHPNRVMERLVMALTGS